MRDRAEVARQAAAGLRAFAGRLSQNPVMIGFDGFVDSIISVVDKRHDAQRFDAVPTIDAFGRKILQAAGRSSNYELVVSREKLGGNGPIMANALAAFGLPITFIGTLGRPVIHSVFAELAMRTECHSLAGPGLTDALEFHDGKLMLGKHGTLKQVNWQTLCEVVGEGRFGEILQRSRMLGMVNWTMLPNLAEIWQQMVDRKMLSLPQESGERRLVFIDLADPEKRTADDLRRALDFCRAFERHANVILGLNTKEAVQVARALDVAFGGNPDDEVEQFARAIRQALSIHGVVIHPVASAAACCLEETGENSGWFAGPRIGEAKILTGGGDHFNAGFCLGRLAGLPVDASLCTGVSTSGFYVSNATSPTLEQLIRFIESLPDPAA